MKVRKARLGPDAKEAIGDEIREGATVKEICKKYGISLPTFYSIRKTFGNRTVDRVVAKLASHYKCGDDGFRFKSRLPRKEVICPQCRSENVELVEEAPVREE